MSIKKTTKSEENLTKWKRAIFNQILIAYKAKNPGALAKIMKDKFKIERQTVYDWRKGKSKPTEQLLLKISADTGRPLFWLLLICLEEASSSSALMPETDYTIGWELFHTLPSEEKNYAIEMLKIFHGGREKEGTGFLKAPIEPQSTVYDRPPEITEGSARAIEKYADRKQIRKNDKESPQLLQRKKTNR